MTARRFTRRHWGRELASLAAFPVSMLTSKGRGPRARRELSMQRVILLTFVVAFARHWPPTWNPAAVTALAVLTFALIIETLFAAVPVREGLAALVSIFGSAVAKRTRTLTVEEEEVAPPAVGAPFEPEKGEGDL